MFSQANDAILHELLEEASGTLVLAPQNIRQREPRIGDGDGEHFNIDTISVTSSEDEAKLKSITEISLNLADLRGDYIISHQGTYIYVSISK